MLLNCKSISVVLNDFNVQKTRIGNSEKVLTSSSANILEIASGGVGAVGLDSSPAPSPAPHPWGLFGRLV